MEIGYDAVLLNSAVSQSVQPEKIASTFCQAINAGRIGYLSGLIRPQKFAVASTVIDGNHLIKQ